MIIEIGEHCFGPIARLDGEAPFDGEYSSTDSEEVKDKVLSLLLSIKDKLDLMDWRSILEIIVNRGNFECTEENWGECDQCGNYNTYNKYESIDE